MCERGFAVVPPMGSIMLTYSTGLYEDGWSQPDCYLEIETATTVDLGFYLPRLTSGGPDEKLVVVCDGSRTVALLMKRGAISRLTIAPRSMGLASVQIYVAEPEPTVASDKRVRGVLLNISAADGSHLMVVNRSYKARQIQPSDLHHGYALASSLLHRQQYLLQLEPYALPADPVLHYLMIGHLLGLALSASVPIADPPSLAWQADGTCNVDLPISLLRFANERGKQVMTDLSTVADKGYVAAAENGEATAAQPSEPLVEADTVPAPAPPAKEALASRPKAKKNKTASAAEPAPTESNGPDEATDTVTVLPVDLSHDARAHIEGGLCTSDGTGGLVFGWALHHPDANVALVTETGAVVPLSNCFRRLRQDVMKAFPDSEWSQGPSAFIGFVPGLISTSELRIVVGAPANGSVIARRRGFETVEGDTVELARRIFAIETPMELFAERTLLADWPLLSSSLARRQSANRNSLQSAVVGTQSASPKLSIIVPLYGRIDFMEAQIMEFARDSFLCECCEVVYVVDDPPKWQQAEELARTACALFDFSVRIVGNGTNNGFSGANNLGVDASSGALLLFLNSDVIPQSPGWLEMMLETYCAAPDIGAVGARLVFPDGGIQHAGMNFRYDHKFRVWTNAHPSKGFAPELDTGPTTQDVPAVTGACLLTSRENLAAIGGWDEGYLIGDFEDSHLCLALRARGLRITYDRRAQLVHLERQSFGRVGEPDFRQKVVVANAARHQTLWSHLVEIPDTSA